MQILITMLGIAHHACSEIGIKQERIHLTLRSYHFVTFDKYQNQLLSGYRFRQLISSHLPSL